MYADLVFYFVWGVRFVSDIVCIISCFLFSSWGNLPLQSYWSLSCDHGLHCGDEFMWEQQQQTAAATTTTATIIQQPHRGRNNISRGQFAPAPVHDYRSFTRVAQRCIAQRLLLENIALLIWSVIWSCYITVCRALPLQYLAWSLNRDIVYTATWWLVRLMERVGFSSWRLLGARRPRSQCWLIGDQRLSTEAEQQALKIILRA